MKKLAPVLVLAIACASAQAASNDSVKKQLTANYAAFSKAFQTKNMSTVAGLMTDDYVVVQPGGKTSNKTEILQDFNQQAGMINGAKWDRKITKLTVSGKQAVAIVDGNFSGNMAGQDGKPHVFRLIATTQDTWTKTPSGYRLQKSVVQKNKVTIDGKEMPRRGA